MGDAGGGDHDAAGLDRQAGLAIAEEEPFPLEDHPDVITGMDVGMDVLAGPEAPQSGAGMRRFTDDDLVGLDVAVGDLVAVVAGSVDNVDKATPVRPCRR